MDTSRESRMTTPAGRHSLPLLIHLAVCVAAVQLQAADWPQWRGANRDAKVTDFAAPKTWPKDLAQKWKVAVGRGDASPALVGDKLYVFTRDEAGEVTLCLDAATGKELWRDKYDAPASTEPRGEHPGPRSSPAVAGGKIATYGVRGSLSCLDAATGKMLWRKDDFPGSWPRFFTGSSPLITDNLCIAQLGGEEKGGIVAYDLATGDQKWKWTDDGTAYASAALLTVGETKMLVTLTAKKIVGIGLADGKLLWEVPFPPQGRAYNAATPIVDGQTVIYTGAARGTKAVKIEKAGDAFTAKELWSNADNAVQFNTPVLKDGRVYGISQKGDLFCLDAKDGKTLWAAPLGGGGFGSIVDAGPVLLALTPDGQLTALEPSDKEFKKLAAYKVGMAIYAHPIVAGNKVYIRDKDSVTLWTVE
ncbi:MAG: PQQ-binding-like beta-propeller repeat protein [Planctomycetota bacterium]|nr:PQQ-binding-like beta-propeller repeat protein [Planctomycetota bacterium]